MYSTNSQHVSRGAVVSQAAALDGVDCTRPHAKQLGHQRQHLLKISKCFRIGSPCLKGIEGSSCIAAARVSSGGDVPANPSALRGPGRPVQKCSHVCATEIRTKKKAGRAACTPSKMHRGRHTEHAPSGVQHLYKRLPLRGARLQRATSVPQSNNKLGLEPSRLVRAITAPLRQLEKPAVPRHSSTFFAPPFCERNHEMNNFEQR